MPSHLASSGDCWTPACAELTACAILGGEGVCSLLAAIVTATPTPISGPPSPASRARWGRTRTAAPTAKSAPVRAEARPVARVTSAWPAFFPPPPATGRALPTFSLPSPSSLPPPPLHAVCDAGRRFNGIGCDPCPAGMYSPGGDWAQCSACAAGTYTSSPGQSSCTACNAPFTTTGTGSTWCSGAPRCLEQTTSCGTRACLVTH